MEDERKYMKAQAEAKGPGSIEQDDYDNIWEGLPRRLVPGAIYTREMADMVSGYRIRPMPYDPRFPVHRVWDLGWNDAMAVIFVQKTHPSAITVINYREVSFARYDELIEEFKGYRYNYDTDWMPHDAKQHHPTSGSSGEKTLKALGCKVKIIEKTDDEARIRAARPMFARTYIDDTERPVETGYLGGARLIECLKHYRRVVPKSTDEPAAPKHDQYSHGADAFGGLAEIVEMIRNSNETPPPKVLPAFHNPNRGMGPMGG
jgi:phage terminase large subunit